MTPGGIGTFEEFFEILTLKQLCRHKKPIGIYNIRGYYNELVLSMEAAMQKGFIRENCAELYYLTDDPAELLSYIETPVVETHSVKVLKDG